MVGSPPQGARAPVAGVAGGTGGAGGTAATPRPRVLVEGLDPDALRSVTAVVHLVGGSVMADAGADRGAAGADTGRPNMAGTGVGASGGDVDLVVTGDPTRATAGVGPATSGPRPPCLVIGERGTLRIPGDEELLAEVVRSVAMEVAGDSGTSGTPVATRGGVPRADPGDAALGLRGGAEVTGGGPWPGRGRGAHLVVGVAGWQGGVGTTSLVRALATQVGTVTVDATGAGPGLVQPGEEHLRGVHWADLRATEPGLHPDLVDTLPVIGAGPALVADHRGGATPSDPRLPGVLRHFAHTRDVVVDLGRWEARTALLGGVVDVMCLVGRGDDDSVAHLAGALGVWPPRCPVVVVHTRRPPSPLLEEVIGPALVTWWFGGGRGGHGPRGGRSGRGGRETSRRVSLLWTRMRRLADTHALGAQAPGTHAPDMAAPARGTS